MSFNKDDYYGTGNIGYICREVPNSDVAIVSFGGLRHNLRNPARFVFLETLYPNEVNIVFIKDVEQTWYHTGINGLGNSVAESVDNLSVLLLEMGVSKVIFIGTSMGAYAAILFGVLMNVDVVLSFSPQTFLSANSLKHHGEYRWREQLEKLHSLTLQKHYYDLAETLKDIKYETEIEIYYGSRNELDSRHALQLESGKNVTLHAIDSESHHIAKEFVNSGEIRFVVGESLDKVKLK